jgi:rod shape-determining protein MreC
MMDLQIAEKNRLKLVIDVLFLALSLYGVSKWSPKNEMVSPFKSVMIDITASLQNGINSVRKDISTGVDNYLLNVNASKENSLLKKRILELENELFLNDEVARENARLRELIDYDKENYPSKIIAKVVSWNSSSEFRVLRINKGAKDGILLQSPVVTPLGLVGYVHRLTDNFSDVLTIEDPNNHVDGLLERTRGQGILEGSADGIISLKYIPKSELVIIHDTVMTSGLGNIYPKGIKVGTVSKIEKDSYGVTQSIEIKPSVTFDKLEEVVVLKITKTPQIESEELLKGAKMEGEI